MVVINGCFLVLLVAVAWWRSIYGNVYTSTVIAIKHFDKKKVLNTYIINYKN